MPINSERMRQCPTTLLPDPQAVDRTHWVLSTIIRSPDSEDVAAAIVALEDVALPAAVRGIILSYVGKHRRFLYPQGWNPEIDFPLEPRLPALEVKQED